MLKSQTKEYYDYHDIVKEVEKLSGRKIRDWSGKFNNKYDYSTGDFPAAKWATANGYDWRVLNDPVDEEGKKLRCEINAKWTQTEEFKELDSIPYHDFWHWEIDNLFYGVHNGSYYRFSPKEALAEYQNEEPWIREILEYFIQVFEKNNMPDEVEVHIWW